MDTASKLLASLLLFALALASVVHAQSWPQKPVKIVVPFGAGGNTDAIARVTAERLFGTFDQQFIVENKPGAGGMIAAEFVARSARDGHTLFMATLSQIVTAPMLYKNSIDTVKELAPISIIGTNPFIIAVSASTPATTLPEFVAYVKARPGQLNYGSGGAGAVTHLSAALFLKVSGLDMTHVPYKGGAAALADLIGEQVQMYSGSPSELIAHAKAGRIKLLGVSGDKRHPKFPDVPAIAEFYPGHRAVSWNGLLAPAGTPPAIIERISAEIQRAMREPQFRDKLDALGIDPVMHTPTEFRSTIQQEIAQWRQVIETAGIKPE